MSAPVQEEPPAGQDGVSFLASERCASCGVWLAEDQEWCVECGAARTPIHRPPDWRIGLAISLAVIAVVTIVAILVLP